MVLRQIKKWDIRYLELAGLVGSWSKDPSTKVGAVIVDKSFRVLSLGFNGFPRGVRDEPQDYLNRDVKYQKILHAEQNAMILCSTNNLTGCTLYVNPLPPCNRCALEIIQRGVERVVSFELSPENTRWKESTELTKRLLKEAGIEYVEYPRFIEKCL